MGCKTHDPADTRFRISQFLLTDQDISTEISQNGQIRFSETLGYGKTFPYTLLPPGLYTIEIKQGEKLLISKEVGFGRGDSYTLMLFGMPLPGQKVNQTNLKTTLKRITQGEEAVTSNDYLPQLKIVNDAFQCTATQAKIRWIHLTPGANAISARIINLKNKDTLNFETLSYPSSSALKTAGAVQTKIEWYLGNKGRIVADTTIVFRPRMLYTFVIGGKQHEFINKLELRTYLTEESQLN